jgi:uncharacterized protein
MADLDSITAAAAKAKSGGLPPVHLWNPPFCGDIDMRIASDGTWFYGGTPIGRPAMVRLFSTILRKDPEQFVLVTPVERVGITVDDAPFLAVELQAEATERGQALRFRTNVDDWVTADATHQIRFEPSPGGGLKPYILVRGGLWAKATRAVYLELVTLAATRIIGDAEMLGVESHGAFFAMAPVSESGDVA